MKPMAILVSLCIFLNTYAVDSPKHPEATSATKEYETKLKWTKARYDNEAKVAHSNYIGRLKKALALALRAQNLEEANRISKVIKTTTAPTMEIDTASSKFPKELAGDWTCYWTGGGVSALKLSSRGEVLYSDTKKGTVIRENGDLFLKLENDPTVLRLTVAKNRIIIEQFNADYPFEKGVPGWWATASREAKKSK